MTRARGSISESGRRFANWRPFATGVFMSLFFVADALAATHAVVQIDRSFKPSEIAIDAGEAIAFSNQDDFIHQIYIDSDQIAYDSAEQPPGQSITIPFPKTGVFAVRCHIHPKMLLLVHVK